MSKMAKFELDQPLRGRQIQEGWVGQFSFVSPSVVDASAVIH